MRQNKQSIQRELRALRKIIEGKESGDVLTQIAYAIECTLRWATEDTVKWDRPTKDARRTAEIISTMIHPHR